MNATKGHVYTNQLLLLTQQLVFLPTYCFIRTSWMNQIQNKWLSKITTSNVAIKTLRSTRKEANKPKLPWSIILLSKRVKSYGCIITLHGADVLKSVQSGCHWWPNETTCSLDIFGSSIFWVTDLKYTISRLSRNSWSACWLPNNDLKMVKPTRSAWFQELEFLKGELGNSLYISPPKWFPFIWM